jgi:hypothetical protein
LELDKLALGWYLEGEYYLRIDILALAWQCEHLEIDIQALAWLLEWGYNLEIEI